MVTADTVTDEQIRELARNGSLTARAWALAALRVTYTNMGERERHAARARCAEILNALLAPSGGDE